MMIPTSSKNILKTIEVLAPSILLKEDIEMEGEIIITENKTAAALHKFWTETKNQY